MKLAKLKTNGWNHWLIASLASLSLAGGLVYRLYALDWPGVAASLALTGLILFSLWHFGLKFNHGAAVEPNNEKEAVAAVPGPRIWQFWLYSALWGTALGLLMRSGTAASIISPWESASLAIVALYGLASLVLLLYFVAGGRSSLLLTLHYFLSFSVILFVYRLGYGYDFFVHQATLELIDKAGLVLPKTNYYLGQYGLIISLHRLTALPLYWLHLLLVPVLAAILLPRTALGWLAKLGAGPRASALALLLLVLPFSFLTFSTPQNLAFLFLILTLMLAWQAAPLELAVAGLLALAALLTQPIAGVPALLLVLWRWLLARWPQSRIFWQPFLLALAALGLPLAFSRLEPLRLADLRFVWPAWLPSAWPALPNAESLGWNTLYFFGANWYWIVLVLVVAGWLVRCPRRNPEFRAPTYLGFAFLLAHWLTKLLPFNFLIGYEREDYAQRFLAVGVILFLPLIAAALDAWLAKIMAAKRPQRLAFLVFLALWLSASFYLSYPRFDRYANARGYSVGLHDLAAVDWIEADAAGQPYIVLANQQVSAAALSRFGFAHYYNGLFYYPVPTASPLYQSYLKMVYEQPGRETAQAAAELAGVKRIYFVLNKYWHAFPKVRDEAALAADHEQVFGQKEVVVFRFDLAR